MSRILPILSIMIAIGTFFGYVTPTWSGSIAATKEAIANDDQALLAANKYITQQNLLASSRDAINPSDLARLNTLLPNSVDNVGLILDLNALAARSGLSLSNVDVSAGSSNVQDSRTLSSPDGNAVGSVNLSLTAVGSYAALQSFLQGVEKSARLLDVRDIVVKGSDTGVYVYQLTLRLYWLR